MKNILTLDDVNVRGKTVIVRVDINSPVDKKGKIEITERFFTAAKTIEELSKKKAKVVVLAHQGRRGNPDFIHLNQHARALSKIIGKEVKFVPDVIGEKAKSSIKKMKSGDILLLDNVRLLDDETIEKSPKDHAKSSIVINISPFADLFVNDAFSAAHRSHASIVGFTAVLPSYAGRTMEKEIKALQKVITRMKVSKHDTFVLGGAKPEDPIEIMKFMLKRGTLETVLTCGIVGELFLIASGYNLGKKTMNFLKKRGFLKSLEDVKRLLKKYKKKIVIPIDVAVDKNGKRIEIDLDQLPTNSLILDIGTRTFMKYASIITKSKDVVMKGPVGVYENNGFEIGTKAIIEAIANCDGFTLIGGGHTLAAMKKLKIEKDRFSHVSLGGGALITFLSGKKMPGIETLRRV